MSNLFEKIYSEYKSIIYTYFYKLTFDKEISEELMQDTFLKAFKYFSTFKGQSTIKTWLFKIARNTYLTYVSKNNINYDNSTLIETIKDNQKHISNIIEKLMIEKILKYLSEYERTLIIFRDINNLTYKEISSILDISEGKVKIGLHRARKKFKELYYYNMSKE